VEVEIMAKCEITGKKPSFGHNVSHSKRRTRRVWKPNIQKVTMTDANGKRRTMKVATSTLRTLYKTRKK
jgi:large subunit ribosomal protein L28